MYKIYIYIYVCIYIYVYVYTYIWWLLTNKGIPILATEIRNIDSSYVSFGLVRSMEKFYGWNPVDRIPNFFVAQIIMLNHHCVAGEITMFQWHVSGNKNWRYTSYLP